MVVSVCKHLVDVVFLDRVNSKEEVFEILASKAEELGYISDKGSFLKELAERENLMSTGIGLGVAVPHVKSDVVKGPFIILGVLQEEFSEWGSVDDLPINFVFLVGVPKSEHRLYLQLLSRIVLKIKNPARREKLLQAKSREEVERIINY